MDEKYVLNWLVVQIFQNTFTLIIYDYNIKFKLYPYTLGLHQLENIIIIIDVYFHVLVIQFCKIVTCIF